MPFCSFRNDVRGESLNLVRSSTAICYPDMCKPVAVPKLKDLRCFLSGMGIMTAGEVSSTPRAEWQYPSLDASIYGNTCHSDHISRPSKSIMSSHHNTLPDDIHYRTICCDWWHCRSFRINLSSKLLKL